MATMTGRTGDLAMKLLASVLPRLQSEFESLPGVMDDPASEAAMLPVLMQAAERMADNYPYFHPLYAGQMLKPPHPVARAAYAMAMWLNPNNHARDGGRASSRMEMEAVAEIAAMFGWTRYLGHLTSGGTFANLEALWIAGQLAPGKCVIASEQAHYTHARISSVLKLDYRGIATDDRGRMDIMALEAELERGDVGTVVVTLGTTALGAVDPLHHILQLRQRYGFRVHVDAAYGGYFRLISSRLDAEARAAYEAIHLADSIVVDPHKHGLQPYGCGCVLFRDADVGRFYKHDSPYTYFTSEELHLGEISLECSRAGAAAVALWTTQRLLPLVEGGEFAEGLGHCHSAALRLYQLLSADRRFVTALCPELDIVVWAVRGATIEESSRLAKEIFARTAEDDLHLALVQLQATLFPSATWSEIQSGAGGNHPVTCLRSVLMKPEHLQWLDTIWMKLDNAMEIVGRSR